MCRCEIESVREKLRVNECIKVYVCPFEMKIVLILFIGGVNYAMLTTALVCMVWILSLFAYSRFCMCICAKWPLINPNIFISLSLFLLPWFSTLTVDLLDQLVDNQLYLGIPQSFNTTYADCVWREPFKDRTFCSKEVQIWLTSNGIEELVRNHFTFCAGDRSINTYRRWLITSSAIIWKMFQKNIHN